MDTGVLTVDLRDLLESLSPYEDRLRWTLAGVEAVGGSSDDMHRMSDSEVVVDGAALRRLAASVGQVVEGRFVGMLEGSDEPWLVIRAVDSSAYDVLCEDPAVVEMISRRFRLVTECPE